MQNTINFAILRTIIYFAKIIKAFIISPNLNISQRLLHIRNLRITRASNLYIICSIHIQTVENGRNFGHFAKITHEVLKSKFFIKYLDRIVISNKGPVKLMQEVKIAHSFFGLCQISSTLSF